MHFIPDQILPDVILIRPTVFGDQRGYFYECYHQSKFHDAGITDTFVQDNQSQSSYGVLRGLHFQRDPKAQAKCVRAVEGSLFDVAVDVRPGSPTFGKWTGYNLSSENKHMLYIPAGFAHGFLVTSDTATLHYKCSDLYAPELEDTLLYNDPDVGIEWPIKSNYILSDKDRQGHPLSYFK